MAESEGPEKLISAAAGAEQPVDGPPAGETNPAAADPMQKYNEERTKRVKAEGIAQYIDLLGSDKFQSYQDDPWLEDAGPHVPALKDGDNCKYLVLGAGFGGLLFAVRLIQNGANVNDIRIVDSAGGFGGTWYWNRYPGLMCDVESYIYLPLLEETGYMPKHKYSYGAEIRDYANLIADKYDLRDKAAFQMQTDSLTWDEQSRSWVVKLTHGKTSTKKGSDVTVQAQFVFAAGGLLNNPKLPKIEGIGEFKGHSFHTSRWDYDYTGGTPSDPSLAKLKGKTVGVLGTGATCVQALPHLAKWAKEVYVFQRTPSSVDERNNEPTDSKRFGGEIATKDGWQKERALNFNAFLTNMQPKPHTNMVNDAWSKAAAYYALIGGPAGIGLTPEKVPEHVGTLHALDYPRQEAIRQRIDSIIRDQSLAETLKPYYPSWCKRPCFHDEYLQCFNQPNVHLIDTDGKGISRLTLTSVVANGKDYPLDCLIFGTGFRTPTVGSPAARAGITITGRNGLSLDQKWTDGVATIHGVISRDFPNLFYPGPIQAAASANQMFVLSTLSEHVAYIISTAQKQRGGDRQVIIEPTEEGEEEWSMRVLAGAMSFAAMVGCTPGYLNAEGQADRVMSMGQEAQMKAGRGGIWGPGINDYTKIIEEWRIDGKLHGLQVSVH